MHSVHMIYSMTLHKMGDTSRVEHEATLKFIEEVHNCLAVWDISRVVYQDGKVEKTDPCSTDYPLTPTPWTELGQPGKKYNKSLWREGSPRG